MSTHNICFAGLSRDEEAQVTAIFQQVNARLGNPWTLTTETAAGVLVIDMDSMYGQMSLMKAIGSGQILVSLTASGRAETDFVLTRPVTAQGLAELLSLIDGQAPSAQAAPPAPAHAPDPAFIPVSERITAPMPVVNATLLQDPIPAPPVAAEPAVSPAAAAPEPAPARPAETRLADLLRLGALPGPVRLQQPGAADLVLDPATQTYLAGAALKPLLPHCAALLQDADLQAVDAADLPALAGSLGAGQPWSRLAWLCALTSGNGALLPGYSPNDKYKLLKWPQTEREFPKHFRIATVMMKGPATLADIAGLSTTPLAEVIDYVNACLASGVAEPEAGIPPAADSSKGGGLMGRFRR